jgi:hypothetical protein
MKDKDMNQQWTKERWDDTLKQTYTRATTDDAFRKRCLTDAAGAIKEISGWDLAEGMKVRFVEKLEEQVLVLPPSIAVSELSMEELANVAGGVASASGCDYGGPGEAETQTVNCPTTKCSNPLIKKANTGRR